MNRLDYHVLLALAAGVILAGIIGAAYDNAADGAPKRSKGVSGANPVARMYGYPAPTAGIDPQEPSGATLPASGSST